MTLKVAFLINILLLGISALILYIFFPRCFTFIYDGWRRHPGRMLMFSLLSLTSWAFLLSLTPVLFLVLVSIIGVASLLSNRRDEAALKDIGYPSIRSKKVRVYTTS